MQKFLSLFINLIESPLTFFIGILIALYFFRNQIEKILIKRWVSIEKLILYFFLPSIFFVYLVLVTYYLFSNAVIDQVAPSILSVSGIVARGAELYHSFNAPAMYSLLYGPSPYIANALFLKIFGFGLWQDKLGSVLASFGSLFLTYYSIKHFFPRKYALAILGLTSAIFLLFWTYSFEAHTDAFVLFAVALALFAAIKCDGYLAKILFGFALGFGMGVKITALFYFMPLIYLFLKRFSWKAAFHAILIGAFICLSPFIFLKNISLVNYILWLASAGQHKLETMALSNNISYMIFLLIPLFVFYAKRGVEDLKKIEYLLILSFCLFCSSIIGAKAGSGQNHLLPLVPLVLYAYATVFSSKYGIGDSAMKLEDLILASFLLTTLIISLAVSARISRILYVFPSKAATDLSDILSDYPEIKWNMGYSNSGDSANDTYLPYLRPIIVFKTGEYILDKPALSDFKESKREMSEALIAKISNCNGDGWLFPKGDYPFEGVLGYGKPIFESNFINLFESKFYKHSSSEYFDMWKCR